MLGRYVNELDVERRDAEQVPENPMDHASVFMEQGKWGGSRDTPRYPSFPFAEAEWTTSWILLPFLQFASATFTP